LASPAPSRSSFSGLKENRPEIPILTHGNLLPRAEARMWIDLTPPFSLAGQVRKSTGRRRQIVRGPRMPRRGAAART
jgi:hypothetical protein